MTSASRYAAVLCLAMGACASAAAAETTRYVVLVDGGKHAGHQVVTRDDDGSTRVDFRFKDNGRGPELQERYTLAPDGTYLTYAVQGTSTYGAPVQETFRRDGDHVQWKTTSDEGAMAVDGTQLYVPLGGTPASFAVAMGALAREDDGALSLLPHGTLRMRDIATVEIRRGGEPRTVQLVALTGLGLTPAFAWATTGASPRLFAYIIPGYLQLIEEGWEQSAGALETRQKRAEDEDLAALQAALAHPLEGALLINNARVFDSERAVLGPVSDVLVSGGRIVEVVPDPGQGAADRSPSRAGRDAAAVIEAEGRALLPGLFDSHAHIGPWEGGLHLAAGVTTVRDMGNDNATLQRLMQQGESKQLMLPRVVPAGFIEGESEFSARNGFVVATLDEAKRADDWYEDNGYPQVKIYNSFPREILPATIDYAHDKGLRVSGHVPAFLRAEEVVGLGFDELQHINQLLLNFFVTPDTDTRTLERFYLVAKRTAGLDLASPEVRDFIALLAERDVVVDPTLATFEFLHQRDGELSPIVAPVATHLPASIQRSRRAAELDIPDDATGALYDRSFAKLVEFTGLMHDAGVTIVAGTDEMAGFTLQRELELYVQAGLTPGEALQTATWNAAEVAGVLDDRGTIAPGKRADLILVDGDPATDITAIRDVATVLMGDTLYYPAEIHQALGVSPFATPVKASKRQPEREKDRERPDDESRPLPAWIYG